MKKLIILILLLQSCSLQRKLDKYCPLCVQESKTETVIEYRDTTREIPGETITLIDSLYCDSLGNVISKLDNTIRDKDGRILNLTNTPLIVPLAWIDLSTGTIVSQNSGFLGSNLTIIPDGSWYNVSYTLNAQASGNVSVIILNLSPDGSTTSYVGDITKGVAVWGLQITESSTIKPYRQTLSIAEGQGTIPTWYDQSGNGRNLIQSTLLKQPNIVTNGNIVYENGKIALTYNDDLLSTSSYLPTQVNNLALIQVFRVNTLSATNPRYSAINNSALNINTQFGIITGHNRYFVRRNNNIRHTDTTYTVTNTQYIVVNGVSSNTDYFARNGVNSTMNIIGATPTDNSFLGNGFHTLDGYINDTNFKILTGTIQEVIIYDFDQFALITEIKNTINNYYGIY